MAFTPSENEIIDRFNLSGKIGNFYGGYFFDCYGEGEPRITFFSNQVEEMEMLDLDDWFGRNYGICGRFGLFSQAQGARNTNLFFIRSQNRAEHVFLCLYHDNDGKKTQESLEFEKHLRTEAVYKYRPDGTAIEYLVVPKDAFRAGL